MKRERERTPDYIMITILLLYLIGYPLQSYLRSARKPRTESHVKDSARTDKEVLPNGNKGQ